jgi:hypothetical protein
MFLHGKPPRPYLFVNFITYNPIVFPFARKVNQMMMLNEKESTAWGIKPNEPGKAGSLGSETVLI